MYEYYKNGPIIYMDNIGLSRGTAIPEVQISTWKKPPQYPETERGNCCPEHKKYWVANNCISLSSCIDSWEALITEYGGLLDVRPVAH